MLEKDLTFGMEVIRLVEDWSRAKTTCLQKAEFLFSTIPIKTEGERFR